MAGSLAAFVALTLAAGSTSPLNTRLIAGPGWFCDVLHTAPWALRYKQLSSKGL